ncbi:hypothetical protein CEXT_395641 [Caerostris extrusa]|uniref:Uncharacterized protein n=1 Tax=Caerostris extrusa TaxID=172846 RepID=A0AAV4Y7T4_CAEEX|nr:hypothetical protein CEXT_395641 [Caerostris extrusa]
MNAFQTVTTLQLHTASFLSGFIRNNQIKAKSGRRLGIHLPRSSECLYPERISIPLPFPNYFSNHNPFSGNVIGIRFLALPQSHDTLAPSFSNGPGPSTNHGTHSFHSRG